nr:unnamed protein product [Callosobruchus analis]
MVEKAYYFVAHGTNKRTPELKWEQRLEKLSMNGRGEFPVFTKFNQTAYYKKKETVMRQLVSPEEKLLLTLRCMRMLLLDNIHVQL